MSTFLALPAEILEEIYHYLGGIDDVHSLGRSCKNAAHILRQKSVYTEIMRSVIGNHSHHRFDICLSQLLNLHRDVAMAGRPIIATQPPPNLNTAPAFNILETRLMRIFSQDCPNGPCIRCLPDALVHEILARYQGLHVLEDLWLARQLSRKDIISLSRSKEVDDLIRAYNRIGERNQKFLDGDVPSRTCDETRVYVNFNADQKKRFYYATIVVWILNEIRWFFMQFERRALVFTLQTRMMERCREWIDNRTLDPLLERMDRYTVFRFMYHHLLPLHSKFLADRCSSKLPLTFPSDLDRHTWHRARFLQIFLAASPAYLQPPDIIDLVIRSQISRRPPYPRLHLPGSTEHYRLPYPTIPILPSLNYSVQIFGSRVLGSTISIENLCLGFINQANRASPLQSPGVPRPPLVYDRSKGGLLKLTDDMGGYLERQACEAFDLYSSRHGSAGSDLHVVDIKEVFSDCWNKMWWMCWWWANSDDKAQMKMNRWIKKESRSSDRLSNRAAT